MSRKRDQRRDAGRRPRYVTLATASACVLVIGCGQPVPQYTPESQAQAVAPAQVEVKVKASAPAQAQAQAQAQAGSRPPVLTAAVEQPASQPMPLLVKIGDSTAGNYLAGRLAQKNRDYGNASKFLSHALASDPENRDLLRRAFLASLAKGRFAEASDLAGCTSATMYQWVKAGKVHGWQYEDAPRSARRCRWFVSYWSVAKHCYGAERPT